MTKKGGLFLDVIECFDGLRLLLIEDNADIEHGHCVLIACLLVSYGCGWNPIEHSPEEEEEMDFCMS